MVSAFAVARRVAFAVFSVYLVVSLAFLAVAVPPDPRVDFIEHQLYGQGKSEEQVEQAVADYRERRNLDDPLPERYVGWLIGVATLEWGVSYSRGQPVTGVVASSLPYTLLYVLPAMAVSVGGGLLAGLYSATHRRSLLDRLATGTAYLGFGLPEFWLGQILLLTVVGGAGGAGVGFDPQAGPLAPGNRLVVGLAAAVLATTLLAGQLRYTRAELLEYVGTDVVKLVRAKGAGPWRVGRHLLRIAAVPLLSLSVTELLGVLVLNVYVVEYVFGIPGLGRVTLTAIQDRDVPLVIGTSLVVALIGVLGNAVQDAGHALLDPRLGEE